MKCPCTKNCPNRSATCHSECAAGLEWDAYKKAQYARNAAHRNSVGNTPAQERRVRERDKMRKEGRIK